MGCDHRRCTWETFLLCVVVYRARSCVVALISCAPLDATTGIGAVLGPTLGGVLARPCSKEGLFGPDSTYCPEGSILVRFPYALACITGAAFLNLSGAPRDSDSLPASVRTSLRFASFSLQGVRGAFCFMRLRRVLLVVIYRGAGDYDGGDDAESRAQDPLPLEGAEATPKGAYLQILPPERSAVMSAVRVARKCGDTCQSAAQLTSAVLAVRRLADSRSAESAVVAGAAGCGEQACGRGPPQPRGKRQRPR